MYVHITNKVQKYNQGDPISHKLKVNFRQHRDSYLNACYATFTEFSFLFYFPFISLNF